MPRQTNDEKHPKGCHKSCSRYTEQTNLSYPTNISQHERHGHALINEAVNGGHPTPDQRDSLTMQEAQGASDMSSPGESEFNAPAKRIATSR
eukprot:scaffold87552_cov18-Prasinocladus_malaysianus.AAC.1